MSLVIGSLVDDFDDFEIIQKDEKSGDLVIGGFLPPTTDMVGEPMTPKAVVEILLCPICQHKCEGSQELLEHYWGYCQKTRTYFDLHT